MFGLLKNLLSLKNPISDSLTTYQSTLFAGTVSALTALYEHGILTSEQTKAELRRWVLTILDTHKSGLVSEAMALKIIQDGLYIGSQGSGILPWGNSTDPVEVMKWIQF